MKQCYLKITSIVITLSLAIGCTDSTQPKTTNKAESEVDSTQGKPQENLTAAKGIEYRDPEYMLPGAKKKLKEKADISDYEFDMDLTTKEGELKAWLMAGDFESSRTDGEQDLVLALYWFTKAAEKGSYEAMHRLGEYHHFKVGGEESESGKALQWYRRAASAGYVPSMINLTTIAFQENRNNDAMAWLKTAAKHGDVRSMMTLADSYFQGKTPFEKDLKRAKSYYFKAAEKGNSVAQRRLGVMLFKGLGGDENLTAAYKWFLVAKTDTLNPGSKALLEYIDKTVLPVLSKPQIDEASKAAKEFVNKKQSS